MAREGDGAKEPLLEEQKSLLQESRPIGLGGRDAAALEGCPPLADLLQELAAQARVWLPLAANLALNYSLAITNLSFLGHLGTSQLAAASLAVTLANMSGKLFLMGLCGGLDTQATQAHGAGNSQARPPAMGVIFQRCVYFLLPHCALISGLFLGLPHLLRHLGQPAELCAAVGAFLLMLLPFLWLEALNRPLNRILVAQSITAPQAWVSFVVALQHIPACYLFIHTLGDARSSDGPTAWPPVRLSPGMGYLGAAAATCWSTLLSVSLLVGYIAWAGMGATVWGTPTREAFKGWRHFAHLAYASAAMRCIESWSFSICTVASGFLPNAEAAVAAISVAFNLYGVLFMPFAAQSLAACTRVGNSLGAGRPARARLAALAAMLSAPATWVLVAALLVAPPSQRALLALFTDGTDVLLLARMRSLLGLVVVLELFDGLQARGPRGRRDGTVLSGIVAGAGKQRHGSAINAVAYWVLAVPLAMVLAFKFGLGVEGMYSGMVVGPFTQASALTGPYPALPSAASRAEAIAIPPPAPPPAAMADAAGPSTREAPGAPRASLSDLPDHILEKISLEFSSQFSPLYDRHDLLQQAGEELPDGVDEARSMAALKRACKAWGLPQTGKKADMVQRLQDQVQDSVVDAEGEPPKHCLVSAATRRELAAWRNQVVSQSKAKETFGLSKTQLSDIPFRWQYGSGGFPMKAYSLADVKRKSRASWGTYDRFLRSQQRSKEALDAFMEDYRAKREARLAELRLEMERRSYPADKRRGCPPERRAQVEALMRSRDTSSCMWGQREGLAAPLAVSWMERMLFAATVCSGIFYQTYYADSAQRSKSQAHYKAGAGPGQQRRAFCSGRPWPKAGNSLRAGSAAKCVAASLRAGSAAKVPATLLPELERAWQRREQVLGEAQQAAGHTAQAVALAQQQQQQQQSN
eukprot:scaffold3.g6737.t1